MLVFCRQTVVYIILPYHKQWKETALMIDCIMYADVIGDLKINMFLRQSIWSTNKILKKKNSSFRISKCKFFLSSLAPLARIFFFLHNVSVLSVILSFIVPYHRIDCICMQMHFETWNTYISEALARAYKLHIYMIFFFLSVNLGVLPPPPPPPPPNTQ